MSASFAPRECCNCRCSARLGSDVDVAVKLDPKRRVDLFQFYGLADQLETMLNAKVDLLCEPIEREALRKRVERDRAHVF